MKSEAVAAFWSLAEKDAAVQEQLVVAAEQADPMAAVVRIATQAGFDFSIEDLQASLSAELTDEQLDAVAGGADVRTLLRKSYTYRSPTEWFAEQ